MIADMFQNIKTEFNKERKPLFLCNLLSTSHK